MAIRKIRDHVLKPDKTTDIIHYESSADIIVVQPVQGKITATNVQKALEDLADIAANGGVTSVNGQTGAVILGATDVGAEPAFAKNTAFNKNFGTDAGTVMEGNDTRVTGAVADIQTIKGQIGEINTKNSEQDGAISTAQAKADEAYNLAQGRAKAVSFATYNDMVAALKAASKTDYKVGDNLFIVATDVPDYWISAVLDNNTGDTGYFSISPLESQKVDLSEYQKKTDNSLNTTNKTVVGAINEVKGTADGASTKADNAMPKAGGAFTGAVTVQAPTAEMNPATKQYVDTAINAVKQFEYQVVTELPTAAQATMGKIYLKAHSHNPSDGQPDSYDEFITVQSGSTYKWERIGNTDIDLSGYVPTTRKINNKALSSDISLGASDVGVTEAAFPGLNKTGTITGITMNGASKGTSGVVDLGTVITAHQDISGKQDKLTAEQLNAVNSGITEAKVGTYDGYATSKQDKLSTAQLGAVNSGITAAKVGTYDGYAGKITALEGKPGLDKVGTVTSVSAGVGLKITGTESVAPTVEIDEATIFVFDCGSATVNIG